MKRNTRSTFAASARSDEAYERSRLRSIKRSVAQQVTDAMDEQGVTKSEMARRMETSRAALNRLLDPENDSITLATLQKAASAVGREVRLELV